jgi:signal transduction histidine kinase
MAPPWGVAALALAAVGVGGSLYALKAARGTRLLETEIDRSEEARLSSEEALNALLLDRADGAAIWSGSTLHVTAGHARILNELHDSGDFNAVAGTLVRADCVHDLAEHLTALIDEGTPFETRLVGPDDQQRLFSGVTLGARALVTLIDAKGSEENMPRMTDRLVAAEENARTLEEGFANAPIYAWRRDTTGRLDWVNQRYVKGVEAPSVETVLTCQIELLSGDTAQAIREQAKRARDSGGEIANRYTGVIDGTRKTLNVYETAHQGGTFGYALDISTQASASEALVQQMRINEETLDRLHRGLAVFKSDMRLGFANETVTKLWGLNAAWLEGHPSLREILNKLREINRVPHTRNYHTWRDEFIAACNDVNDPLERHWHLPDGTALHVLAQPHPMGGFMLFFEDVTDQYAMRRNAATVSAVYHATFSSLSEGVIVFGLDGRCRLANTAFREMWALSAEELEAAHIKDIGRQCARLFPNRALWEKAIGHVSATGGKREIWNETLERTDGSVIHMFTAPLPDGATMFAFRDVTDSFHKERMLTEQYEKLEEISALKGQFLSSIHGASHELKIPLNTIIGFSDLLRQEMRGKLNDRQHEFVDNISQASNELRQLIGGIIDLAMLESEFFEFCIEAIEIKPMLVSVMDFIRRNSSEGAQMVLECPDDMGTMPGDAPRFREVIHTLINALRNEAVTTDTLEIGVRHRPDHVAIWIGYRNAVIPTSIRDIFGRNDLGSSIPQLRRVELGITLVRQFVERQGGRIAIETGEGQTREAIVCHFLRDADAVRAAINHERESGHPHAAE